MQRCLPKKEVMLVHQLTYRLQRADGRVLEGVRLVGSAVNTHMIPMIQSSP